jgi:hypothetical protein
MLIGTGLNTANSNTRKNATLVAQTYRPLMLRYHDHYEQ